MHPALSLLAEKALNNQHLLVPALYVALSTITSIYGPAQHSLLVIAVSWALIWIPTVCRAGPWSSSSKNHRTSWLAGGFLALAAVCDRAANDKEGIWATRGLLPLLVILLTADYDILATHFGLPSHELSPIDDAASDSSTLEDTKPHTGSWRVLAVVTISALAALATHTSTAPPTSALGLSSVVLTAIGLVLYEASVRHSSDNGDARRGLMSANGTVMRRNSLEASNKGHQLAALRNVALVMTAVCSTAAYLCEPSITPRAITWKPSYRNLHAPADWQKSHYQGLILQCLLMVFVNVLVNILIYIMLSQQGAVHIAFLSLFSYMCASLDTHFSISGIWFTVIYGIASIFFMHNSSSSTARSDVRGSIRFRRIVFGVTVLSVGILLLRLVPGFRHDTPLYYDKHPLKVVPPEKALAPIPMDLKKGHPAEQLIRSAESDFKKLLSRQSKTLAEAVEEYRRRNGILPPPHFDKWYEFATRNDVKLIDEFDTINDSLMPFWALKPATIRKRLRNALGNEENALIGVSVRDGMVVNIEHGQEWEQQATLGMMKPFVQYLPDMDLGFNIHDEPRVVVPSDQLSAYLRKAQEELAAATKNELPQKVFSPRPKDMNDGKRFDAVATSRFNKFAHQQTWTHARLSCPVDSPARYFEDSAPDNLTTYAAAPLNYVYNYSAFSDICNSPSLATRFGFFERPNAFNIIHELVPIFSQSKVSSFQDILYPSRWYWYGKVGYDADHDTTWDNKTNSLYWRGSTTGGFSRNGGWRRQHRQHIVKRVNALDKAKLLMDSRVDGKHKYEVAKVERKDYERFMDVKFSHVGQCDPGDCDAQKEFFNVVDRVDGQDAWYYKHLLDMDGNAFSGRFYSFLKSRSLTYKMAIFREWHSEWLKPWVHYVPLSLIGDEYLDLVRWFGGGDNTAQEDNKGGNGDSVGEKRARMIAERSTEWADQVLRNVDFEVWFFRLLLEYGRVIDDDRTKIGYPGP